MTAFDLGQTKGASFRAFSEWAMREYPAEVSAELHRRMKPDLRRWLDPNAPAWGIVVSSWYPDDVPNSMLDILFELLGPEEHARALREGTRYAMEKTFRGIYRPLARLLVSPDRCARHIQTLWQSNHDSGKVKWELAGPGVMHTELRDWRGHHRFRCEINRLTEEFLLTALGCKGVVSVRKDCLGKGDPRCSSVVTFQAAGR